MVRRLFALACSLVLVLSGCVEGAPDLDASADAIAQVDGEDGETGAGEVSAETDGTPDTDTDGRESDGDAMPEIGPETDTTGCDGCETAEGCIPLGALCPDDDELDCETPLCVTGGSCTGSQDVENGASCGAQGCDGTCFEGECGYSPDSGCVDTNLVFVAEGAPLNAAVTGLDNHCKTVADGNPNLPETDWIAWAGLSTIDHLTRVGDAQAWVRLDGQAFAQTPQQILSGQVWFPPLFNADGVEASELRIATGLDAVGGFGNNCGGFNALDGLEVSVGHAGSGNGGLNHVGDMPCTEAPSVLCLQVEHTTGVVTPEVGSEAGVAFVTDGKFSASEGLAAADTLCQQEAEAEGDIPGGIFRAYLSIAGQAPIERFSLEGGWRRPDGLTVFAGDGEGAIQTPPALLADGTYAPAPAQFWVGGDGANCGDWTSDQGQGAQLDAGFAHDGWAAGVELVNCDEGARLLCLQDTVVDDDACAVDECVTPGLNGGCTSQGTVVGECLVCDTAVSRFALQPAASECTDPVGQCSQPTCVPTGNYTATCDVAVLAGAECTPATCKLGTCDASGACEETGDAAPGTACDDGTGCTVDDVCDGGGQCEGTANCPDDGNECTSSTCMPGAAECTVSPVGVGAPCTASDPCILTPACESDGVCGGPDDCNADANVIFTTAATYSGALGGLEGADAACQSAAKTAGIGGTFVAWLSSSNVDAKDRIGEAQGWVRTGDSKVVAATLDDLLQGKLYYPPNRDENGDLLPGIDSQSQVWSGTNVGGMNEGYATCSDWTSGEVSATGRTGQVHANGTLIYNYNEPTCDTVQHLRCLQIDKVSPIAPPTPQEGRLAFISEPLFSVAEGRAAADALCQDNAVSAGLPPGNYRALLATSTSSAISRFDTAGEPWVDVRGVPVWDGAFDASAAPDAPINLYADGTVPGFMEYIISGPDLGGLGDPASTCNDWQDGTANYTLTVRKPGFASTAWFTSGAPAQTCDTAPRSVYCLQDSHVNYAFVTSASYTGDLAEGSGDGLAAADAKCQTAADDASLPGTYKAWLSSSTVAAWTRFQALDPEPRGWIRVDGRPVADTLEEFAGGELFYPINLDESGAVVPAQARQWSATQIWGSPLGDADCGGWSSEGGAGMVGDPQHSNAFAFRREPRVCSEGHRLMCLGTSQVGAVSVEPQTGRPAFFSNKAFITDSGLDGADVVCQQEALNHQLRPGGYKALLATSSASPISRADTSASSEPFVSTNGLRLAPTAAALANGDTLDVGLALRADGTSPGSDGNWWASLGSVDRISPGINTCDDWTVADNSSDHIRSVPGSVTDTGAYGSSSCALTTRYVQCVLDTPANYVFSTAAIYAPNFGGREGADAICQSEADAAGLAGTFKAWLHDDTMSASEAIGTGVNGWVRMDGKPVASTLDDFAQGRHFYPANLNPTGGYIQVGSAVWSGAASSGGIENNCDNWTSNSAENAGSAGVNDGGSPSFEFFDAGRLCVNQAHLRCLQVDFDAPFAAPAPQEGRPAFISSRSFNTSAGIGAADTLCDIEAGAAGLRPGTYRALLGTSTQAASDRFDLTGEPWVRVDGLLVNDTVADFIDPAVAPKAPIITQADGSLVPANDYDDWVVSSGPDMTVVTPNNCADWSSVAASETMGARINGIAMGAWTSQLSPLPCSADLVRVYCLLDMPE